MYPLFNTPRRVPVDMIIRHKSLLGTLAPLVQQCNSQWTLKTSRPEAHSQAYKHYVHLDGTLLSDLLSGRGKHDSASLSCSAMLLFLVDELPPVYYLSDMPAPLVV